MSSTIPHRYVTPAYPGAAGFDLFNVISGGMGGSGSAYMDTAKIGGPNAGTYAVAFGEDATSSNANRGMRALAQNCDYLDNLLHRLIATTVRAADTLAGAPVTTVILPVSTFLGTAGYSTSPASLNMLFEITDNNDNEIIDPGTGGKVRVASVTLGSGDAIGGGGANGNFSANTVQLNISPSIPTGVTYRIYYGTQTDLADLPIDALTSVKIRGADEVDATVENLFRLLHGNNLSWNAAWTSTIYDLAISGLNERYARSSVNYAGSIPEAYWSTALNVDGAGGWIVRGGPALTMYTNGDDTAYYTDPLNALFAAKFIDTQGDSGGNVGYAAYGSRHSGTAFTGETPREPGHSTFLGLWPHGYQNTVHATNPYTRVLEWATAAFTTVGAYDYNTGEAIVQVTQAGNYFRTGGNSSVSLGYDLLECIYTVSGTTHREIYVIVSMGASNDSSNTTKVRVRRLDGSVPDWHVGYTGTIRWISLSFGVGDGAGPYHKALYAYASNLSVLFDGLFYQVPPSLSASAPDDNVPRTAPRFSAQNTLNIAHALDWGGFSKTAFGPVFNSFLQGDGGINISGASINLDNGNVNITNTGGTPGIGLAKAVGHVLGYSSDGTGPLYAGGTHTTIFDTKLGTYHHLNIGDGPNGNLGGLTLWIDVRNPVQGMILVFTLDHSCYIGGTGGFPIDWTYNSTSTTTNRFSGGDDQILPAGGRTMWTGMCVSNSEVWWTCTRL